jgi:hypothetical protein
MKAYPSIVRVVLDDLVLVEPATVAVVEALGEVPVVERDEGDDVGLLRTSGERTRRCKEDAP